MTYIVTFCPECDEDYQSDLIVVTDREKFIVPVRCFGKKREYFVSTLKLFHRVISLRKFVIYV